MRRSCLWARVGAPTAWPVPAHSASAPSVAGSVDSELSRTTTQPSSVSLASLATIRPFPSGAVYSKPPETIFWPSSHGSVPPVAPGGPYAPVRPRGPRTEPLKSDLVSDLFLTSFEGRLRPGTLRLRRNFLNPIRFCYFGLSMNKFERAKQAKDGLDVFPALMRAAEVGWESLDDDDLMRLKWYGLYAHNTKDGYFMLRTKVVQGVLTAD